MKYDEYGLLVMEHDTTIEGSVGDSCAETGRHIILKEFTESRDFLALMADPKNKYGLPTVPNTSSLTSLYAFKTNTRTKFNYARHPKAKWSWGFGSDQYVPRFIVMGLFSEEFYEEMNPRTVPWSLSSLAVHFPATIGTVFCFLQELKLKIRMSEDCLNWFMVCLYTNYLPKLVTKKQFLDEVRLYYKPETDIKAWTFIDLYEKAADKVWG